LRQWRFEPVEPFAPDLPEGLSQWRDEAGLRRLREEASSGRGVCDLARPGRYRAARGAIPPQGRHPAARGATAGQVKLCLEP